MIPHKMLATGDETGDCLRTAIACLLEIGPIAVPHFLADADRPGEDVWQHVNDWLATQGLTAWYQVFPGEIELDAVLQTVSVMNPDKYYIVCGHGYKFDHVVIACNGKIVHDPAVLGAGLSGPAENGYWLIMTVASDKIVKHT